MIEQPVPEILKGKRLIALDIETTGLNPKYNTIIEIGCIEYDGGQPILFNGKVGFTRMFGGGHSSMYLPTTSATRFSSRTTETHSTSP